MKNVGFNEKKHPRLLWMVNKLAKYYDKEAAVIASQLIEQAGREELERLGIR